MTVLELLKPMAEVMAKPPTPQQVSVMADLLSEYPMEKVAAAIRLGMKRFEFWPAPVRLIELIESPVEEAEDGWSAVMSRVRRLGWPHPPTSEDFSLEVLRAIEAVGGWVAICSCPVDEVRFMGDAFRKRLAVYQGAREIRSTRARLGPSELECLPGGDDDAMG